MTNGVSNAPPPTGPSAQGPTQRNPSERATAADRFRASLANAKSSGKPGATRPSHADKERSSSKGERLSPFEQGPDGLLVLSAYAHAFSPFAGPPTAVSRAHATEAKVHRAQVATAATEAAEQSQRDAELAIENVAVGRAGGTVRVHATMSKGEHQGVELRAVSKDGRVEVELRATDSEAAQRLRAEMGSLRSALDSQGIERVNVSVVDASSEGRGAGHEQSEGRRQEQRERDRGAARDAVEQGPSRTGAPRTRENSGDPSDESDPSEIRDEREYLL